MYHGLDVGELGERLVPRHDAPMPTFPPMVLLPDGLLITSFPWRPAGRLTPAERYALTETQGPLANARHAGALPRPPVWVSSDGRIVPAVELSDACSWSRWASCACLHVAGRRVSRAMHVGPRGALHPTQSSRRSLRATARAMAASPAQQAFASQFEFGSPHDDRQRTITVARDDAA